jgi:hypothetical protein
VSGQVRAPTIEELVTMLRDFPEGPDRTFLENAYWAKAADRYGYTAGGESRAAAFRWEYDWLRERRRRLERMLPRPALGAFLDERRAAA